jgi:hypothetical protein
MFLVYSTECGVDVSIAPQSPYQIVLVFNDTCSSRIFIENIDKFHHSIIVARSVDVIMKQNQLSNVRAVEGSGSVMNKKNVAIPNKKSL